MNSLPPFEPMLVARLCKSLGPRKWNLLNNLFSARVIQESLDYYPTSGPVVIIAKLSLLVTRIECLFNLSELRFPNSGLHIGVRIKRGTPPRWFRSIREGVF